MSGILYNENCEHDRYSYPDPGYHNIHLCQSPDPDRLRIIVEVNIQDFEIQSERPGGIVCMNYDDFDEW